MKKLLAKITSKLPWLAIAAVFLWSVFSIVSRKKSEPSPEETVIRLAHWQLEPGVREGFSEIAAEYEKLHPGVRIIQQAIPESTYGQWLSTQLMGGTAPDIVEVGMVDYSLLVVFYSRYLLPLSPYITRPNPYNAGTEWENAPLYRTFKNGMIHSFIPEVQEYMVMPLAMGSVRLFYNKTLLKELTGLDTPPAEYRAFMEVVRTIQSQKMPNGQPYQAFSGSRYHFSRLEDSMANPLSYGAIRKIDFNRDGRFSNNEMFLGFLSGKIDFSDPSYLARFHMVEDLTKMFQPGWSGLSRDEGFFSFAQQRAVFTAAGIYENSAIQSQADGKFELGIMDFPVPTPEDPVFGRAFEGRRYEKPEGNMPMGIVRTSRHPDVAADFLLFLASQKQNEKFNALLKWIPIVKGAKIDPSLEVFEPNVNGVISGFDPNAFGNSSVRWSQLYSLFLIHQIPYVDMAREFTEFYLHDGRENFRKTLQNRRRSHSQNETLLTGLRKTILAGPEESATSAGNKYRTILRRQIADEHNLLLQERIFTDPESVKEQTLHTYTPAALENARRRLVPAPERPE
ncbi:MAG: carbohydrate ABC transporter substrate-binding protein [Chthoniobacterales bacterium]|nr:carbohydrate ABC transporter substrate-binding protein [Chthoniobacterales bacterium]